MFVKYTGYHAKMKSKMNAHQYKSPIGTCEMHYSCRRHPAIYRKCGKYMAEHDNTTVSEYKHCCKNSNVDCCPENAQRLIFSLE